MVTTAYSFATANCSTIGSRGEGRVVHPDDLGGSEAWPTAGGSGRNRVCDHSGIGYRRRSASVRDAAAPVAVAVPTAQSRSLLARGTRVTPNSAS